MTGEEARATKTLLGGTSFAMRMYGCRNCSHVAWYYDEAATYDEPATFDERSLPGASAVPVPAGTSPSAPGMRGKQLDQARKLLSNIVTMATDQKAIYEVMLSTGVVLEGHLSPFDDESDHIRVNPITRGDWSYFVALEHIVYVHRKGSVLATTPADAVTSNPIGATIARFVNEVRTRGSVTVTPDGWGTPPPTPEQRMEIVRGVLTLLGPAYSAQGAGDTLVIRRTP
jgi:hypothetical protein